MKVTEFRDDLPTPELALKKVVSRFAINQTGRDFVVGDIHGMFGHLRRLLDDIAFDESTDRLFSVGDLVDRGPQSAAALDWLAYPWFHACRGNHEQFAIDSVDPGQLEVWVTHNGGAWWLELDEERQGRFRDAFGELPMALEIETLAGPVGVIHADVPPFLTWESFLQLLETQNRDATLYAMWSRNRISGTCSAQPVPGEVDRLYCGHTPTREVVKLGNVHYIDTGACFVYEGYADARLTLIEIHPERHREHTIATSLII